VAAIGIISTIGSFVLQICGLIDLWNYLIVPMGNFLTIPIPLYSIPLALLVVLAILLVLARTGDSNTITPSNPLDQAEILDSKCTRYVALLCRTPQTIDSLRQKYEEFLYHQGAGRVFHYSFEDCLKDLEERELVIFQDGKWTVTQKALDYIAKFHGD